jgi:hypothetical protein
MNALSKDLTAHAVATQLDAMGAKKYEVGIFDAEQDRMWIRRWNEDEIIRAVTFLKAQNALGKHIYVRPEGSHSLTLVDDLKAETVARMKIEGFAPAAVVETSPANFQAWLAHGAILEPGLSTEVSKEIALQYGGDPGSADWRHFGRLAGFTNRKPQYQQANGHYPFVRLREATGVLYEQAQPLVAKVTSVVEARVEEELARRQAYRRNERANGLSKSVHDFRNAPLYAGDYHRADLAYAAYALSRGATPDDVETAIRTRDLSHKGKESRQRDYVARTIAKAQLAVDRDSGPSR